jgi:hypothetical protein
MLSFFLPLLLFFDWNNHEIAQLSVLKIMMRMGFCIAYWIPQFKLKWAWDIRIGYESFYMPSRIKNELLEPKNDFNGGNII